jgi:hypothetical protein
MAVGVVGPDPDETDLRSDGSQEVRVAGRGTVVRHGHEFGLQPLRDRRHQVALCRFLDVTGGQDPAVTVVQPQHVGAVVQLAAFVPVGPAGRWVQHLHLEVTDRHVVADHGGADRHVVLGGHGEHLGRLRQLRRHGRRPDDVDGEPPQDLRHTTDVIEVRVGDDQQIDVSPTVLTQPARGGVVLACVHEHPGFRRLDEEGVALPHVDRRDPEPVGGATTQHHRQAGDQDGDHRDGSEHASGPPTPPGEQPRTAGHESDHGRWPSQLDDAADPAESVRGREHDARAG